MTKHILCAVDLTHKEDALALVKEAGRLANLEGAGLSIATTLPDYGTSFVGSFFKEGTLKEATQAASDTLHAIADEALSGHDAIQCIVEIGVAYEQILEAAEKCNADLIMVGAHKPDLASKLLGPNAARIVRNASVSVMVVRL